MLEEQYVEEENNEKWKKKIVIGRRGNMYEVVVRDEELFYW